MIVLHYNETLINVLRAIHNKSDFSFEWSIYLEAFITGDTFINIWILAFLLVVRNICIGYNFSIWTHLAGRLIHGIDFLRNLDWLCFLLIPIHFLFFVRMTSAWFAFETLEHLMWCFVALSHNLLQALYFINLFLHLNILMTICEEFVNQFGTLFLWCFALSSSHSAQFFLVLDFILIAYYSVNS